MSKCVRTSLPDTSHLTKYSCKTFKRINGGCVKTRTGEVRRVTVPASVSPGEVEPAIAPDTGRGGSAFRMEGCDCKLAVIVGSSGSIV